MVADNIKWDNLENEDALMGIGSSLQASGLFLFLGGKGTSGEPSEAGHSNDTPRDRLRQDVPLTCPRSQQRWVALPLCLRCLRRRAAP